MKFSFGVRHTDKHSNICTSRAASSQLKNISTKLNVICYFMVYGRQPQAKLISVSLCWCNPCTGFMMSCLFRGWLSNYVIWVVCRLWSSATTINQHTIQFPSWWLCHNIVLRENEKWMCIKQILVNILAMDNWGSSFSHSKTKYESF